MTERVQRFFAVQAEQDSELGPRQVRLRASTEALGRDGLVVVTRGIDLGPYQSNPVMLWQHNRAEPVARAVDVSTQGGDLTVLAEFAAEGTSARADEICGLVKQGIVSGISAAFDIYETEPVDAKNRSAGRRVTKSELLEISFVAVPAERNSLVTERAVAANDNEPERKPLTIRSLYDVSNLACTLIEVGYIASTAAWEAEWEGDNSPVPAMLAASLKQLGEALIAMTQEEVAELLAINGEESRSITDASPGERMQRTVWLLKERAGKAISAATKARLQAAHDHCDNAMRCLREMMDEEDRNMDEGGEEMRAAGIDGAAADGSLAVAFLTPAERFRRQLALRTRAA